MRNEEIFAKSNEYMPGGVNSPVRAYRDMGINPPVMNVVSKTPTVARTIPCEAMGLISATFVSIPPENRIILNAKTPINCVSFGLSN